MGDKVITTEVALKNNCPECFSKEGLKLLFKQQFNENAFYKAITSTIDEELICTNCDTRIYPVRWTDDIERVYDYQKKAFTPKPSSFKLKGLGWLLFIVIDLTILGVVLYKFFPEVLGL